MTKVAYKPFSLAPINQRPPGIPSSYPWQETMWNEEIEPSLIADGWTIVTVAEYEALKASMSNYLASAALQPTIESDNRRYLLRSIEKDKIIAEMAAENMARIRAGIWTVPQLIEVTQHPTSLAILNDIQSLSFELAVQKTMSHTHPLMTLEIKTSLAAKLQARFF